MNSSSNSNSDEQSNQWLQFSQLTIHFPLIRQDDFPSSAGWVNGQGLLEALLNVRAPHALSLTVHGLIGRVAHPLDILAGTFTAAPAAGIHGNSWDLGARAWRTLGTLTWEEQPIKNKTSKWLVLFNFLQRAKISLCKHNNSSRGEQEDNFYYRITLFFYYGISNGFSRYFKE